MMPDYDFDDPPVHKPPYYADLHRANNSEITNPTIVTNNDSESLEEPQTKWSDIMEEYYKKREEIERYLRKKNGDDDRVLIENHPVLSKLNMHLFPLLFQGLCNLLEKVREEQSCYRQKSAFNGIDYLSEYLHNMNVNYPERRENWKYIFDMDWVQEYLVDNPRPYYPFSLIWSREYAALKIQSFIRGYWVRRREDVQEVRMFWKDYQISKQTGDYK